MIHLKHNFAAGQFVELKPNALRVAAAGQYEITQLMPEPDVSSASPRYRIKSCAEIHQRIVPESELKLSAGRSTGSSIDMLRKVFSPMPGVTLPAIED